MWLVAVAQATESLGETTGGLGALGLNATGLIFQIVNFAIVLFLLYRFAYRPLLRVLEARRQTIEESLRSAADIKRTRETLVEEQRVILATARREAETIIHRGEQEARRIQQQAEAAGQKAADQLLVHAQGQIRRQMAETKTTLKKEMIGLVIAASERALGEKIDAKKDRMLVEDAVTQVNKIAKDSPAL